MRAALKLLGDFNFDYQRFIQAAHLYQHILSLSPEYLDVLLALGKCHFKLDNRSASVACYQKALSLDPQNPVALEAMNILKPTNITAPQTPAPLTDIKESLRQADAAFAKGDLKLAAELLKQVLAIEPKSTQVLTALADIKYQLGDSGAALKLLDQAQQMQPNHVPTLILVASMALNLGDTLLFQSRICQVLDLEPENPKALRLVMTFLYQTKQYEKAARVGAALLHLHESSADLLVMLGNCFYHLDESEAARASYEKVLTIDPNHAIARENLAALDADASLAARAPQPALTSS